MNLSTVPCRGCGARELRLVLSFGETPLADVLLEERDLSRPDPRYPLDVAFCPACALIQLTSTVPPEVLYGGDYPYYSSVVPALVEHFTQSARGIMDRCDLDSSSLVIEAASNDGYMLRHFVEQGIPVLGVDPASGPAAAAEEAGVPTLCALFDAKLADELRRQGRLADVLLGNNVLNLVPDPNDFVLATSRLLKPGGLAVIEVPYAVETIDGGAFDNIFHQNVSYLTLTALDRLFRAKALYVNAVERIPVFGGSLRLFIEAREAAEASVETLLADEREKGADRFEYYASFADRVRRSRASLIELLRGFKREGKRIAAYGAAGGMATTLLSFCGIDARLIDYAVDVNRHKQGRYTTGSRLKIHPPTRLVADRPDYVLLLAWNYADEILGQQQEYRRLGGRFIIPVPEPRVV